MTAGRTSRAPSATTATRDDGRAAVAARPPARRPASRSARRAASAASAIASAPGPTSSWSWIAGMRAAHVPSTTPLSGKIGGDRGAGASCDARPRRRAPRSARSSSSGAAASVTSCATASAGRDHVRRGRAELGRLGGDHAAGRRSAPARAGPRPRRRSRWSGRRRGAGCRRRARRPTAACAGPRRCASAPTVVRESGSSRPAGEQDLAGRVGERERDVGRGGQHLPRDAVGREPPGDRQARRPAGRATEHGLGRQQRGRALGDARLLLACGSPGGRPSAAASRPPRAARRRARGARGRRRPARRGRAAPCRRETPSAAASSVATTRPSRAERSRIASRRWSGKTAESRISPQITAMALGDVGATPRPDADGPQAAPSKVRGCREAWWLRRDRTPRGPCAAAESRTTAPSSTAPVTMYFVAESRPSRSMPLEIEPMTRAPSSADHTVPRPPNRRRARDDRAGDRVQQQVGAAGGLVDREQARRGHDAADGGHRGGQREHDRRAPGRR